MEVGLKYIYGVLLYWYDVKTDVTNSNKNY